MSETPKPKTPAAPTPPAVAPAPVAAEAPVAPPVVAAPETVAAAPDADIVVATKDGQEKQFNRTTWDLLGKSTNGYVAKVAKPAELA